MAKPLRVVLTGAECTGKSTLAVSLAEHYGAPCSGEFVREFVARNGRSPVESDLPTIAAGQLEFERRAIEQADQVVFHDTDILSNIVYAAHYFGRSLPDLEAAIRENPAALYLLCATDIPWEGEALQRESPEIRGLLQQKFEKAISRIGLPHLRIAGNLAERTTLATRKIDELLVSKTEKEDHD